MKSNIDLTSNSIFTEHIGIPIKDLLGSMGTPYAKIENDREYNYIGRELFPIGSVYQIKIQKQDDNYLDYFGCDRCGKRIIPYEFNASGGELLCDKCSKQLDHEVRPTPYIGYNRPSNVQFNPMQSFL